MVSDDFNDADAEQALRAALSHAEAYRVITATQYRDIIAAWNTRSTDGLAEAAPITDLLYLLDQAEKIALALADAEAEYRRLYQMHGAGDMRTGRAWDKMRQRGDLARAAIAQAERIDRC